MRLSNSELERYVTSESLKLIHCRSVSGTALLPPFAAAPAEDALDGWDGRRAAGCSSLRLKLLLLLLLLGCDGVMFPPFNGLQPLLR